MTETPEPQTPEMALALYASTAATLAVDTLRRAGLVNGEIISELVGALMAARLSAGIAPAIEVHIEMLADTLLSPGNG